MIPYGISRLRSYSYDVGGDDGVGELAHLGGQALLRGVNLRSVLKSRSDVMVMLLLLREDSPV